MVIQAILALSLYLPLMAGQLSLASPAFYAIGGYVAALLSTKVFTTATTESRLYPPLPFVAEFLVAALLCGVVALIVGFVALRLRGIFLALATIAIVEIVRVLAVSAIDVTGGQPGISAIPDPVGTQIGYLLVAGPLLLFAMFFTYRLERTRVGRAFTALREDELAAAAIGINPMAYKVLAFTLGAILAGMAGVISAHLLSTWNPSLGTFDNSILILAYVLVGGSRTFLGPVAGGMLLTALPEVLRRLADLPGLSPAVSSFLQSSRLILFGILIALSAAFFPQGLLTPELFRLRQPPRSTTAPLSSVSTPTAE